MAGWLGVLSVGATVADLASEESAIAEVVRDAESMKWQGSSSAIESAEYIFRTGAVWLTFRQRGHAVYVIQSVSPKSWNDFLESPSKGRYVNDNWLR